MSYQPSQDVTKPGLAQSKTSFAADPTVIRAITHLVTDQSVEGISHFLVTDRLVSPDVIS